MEEGTRGGEKCEVWRRLGVWQKAARSENNSGGRRNLCNLE